MRDILKDTSLYAIGDFLTEGIVFFTIRFHTHFLSQSKIGTYGYRLILEEFTNTSLILGVKKAYARYFFEYKSHHEQQRLTTTIFAILLTFAYTFISQNYSKLQYNENTITINLLVIIFIISMSFLAGMDATIAFYRNICIW